jgi:hypothetical protein
VTATSAAAHSTTTHSSSPQQHCPRNENIISINNNNTSSDNDVIVIFVNENSASSADLTPPPDRKDVGFNVEAVTPGTLDISECNSIQSYESGVLAHQSSRKRPAQPDQIQCSNQKKKICKAYSNPQ